MLIEKTLKREALFWTKVKKSRKGSKCWEWTGARNDKDYGIITVSVDGVQKFFYAHRVSFEWEFGDIPEGKIVRHKCDNPPCINPSHLEVGTHQENTNDKMERGRYVSGVAEITAEDAVKIRIRRSLGEMSKTIALDYGLTPQHISNICTGVYWPDAGGPRTRRFELTNEIIDQVLIDLETMTRAACAIKNGISLASVQNIFQGKKKALESG